MIHCKHCGRNTDALFNICWKCKRKASEKEREISEIMEQTEGEFDD